MQIKPGCLPRGAKQCPCRGRKEAMLECVGRTPPLTPPSKGHRLTPSLHWRACRGQGPLSQPESLRSLPVCVCLVYISAFASLSRVVRVYLFASLCGSVIVSLFHSTSPIPSGDISAYEPFMMCISCHK